GASRELTDRVVAGSGSHNRIDNSRFDVPGFHSRVGHYGSGRIGYGARYSAAITLGKHSESCGQCVDQNPKRAHEGASLARIEVKITPPSICTGFAGVNGNDARATFSGKDCECGDKWVRTRSGEHFGLVAWFVRQSLRMMGKHERISQRGLSMRTTIAAA